MLIVTRNIGESLIIGDDVKVTILRNFQHETEAKIAIDAPREVPVYREEIYNLLREDGEHDA